MLNEYVERGDGGVELTLCLEGGSTETIRFSDSKLPIYLAHKDLRWNLLKDKNGDKYCVARDRSDPAVKNGRIVYLHALLFGTIGTDQEANHLNWDGRDCRDSNIIVGTRSANQLHRRLTDKPTKRSTTGVRCVTLLPSGHYQAAVCGHYLGCFDKIEDAKAKVTEYRLAHRAAQEAMIAAAAAPSNAQELAAYLESPETPATPAPKVRELAEDARTTRPSVRPRSWMPTVYSMDARLAAAVLSADRRAA